MHYHTMIFRRCSAIFFIWAVTAVWILPAALHAQVRLFVSDGNGVERYDFASHSLSTLVPESAGAFSMTGLTVGPNGNLFVAATGPAPQIFEYNQATGAQIGAQPFVFYEGTPPSPDPHDVINPQGMRFSPLNGNLYVADVSGSTANVHMYGPTGASLGALTDATLDQPSDVAFDAHGNMYVVNPGMANVLVSALGTQPLTEFVSTQSGGLTNPTALTFGPDGKLYVLDLSTSAIDRYNSNGSFDTTVVSFPLFQPAGLAFGPDGKLYVSGIDLLQNAGQILRFTPDGVPDGIPVASGLLNPTFIAFNVPEPSTAMLFGIGAAVAFAATLRRRRLARAKR